MPPHAASRVISGLRGPATALNLIAVDSTDMLAPMADDHIRYDILAQEALRGVMRKVLTEVARTGLPGNHHFFITFVTDAPGVRISSRLRERYPDQMTIVIQYQYWDLKVTDTGFEIGLSFSDVPEKLEIPFSAVRGFYDPSVSFELEFDVKPESETGDQPVVALPGDGREAVADNAPAESGEKKKKPASAKKPKAKSKETAGEDSGEAEEPEGKGAEVVSLDSFRKK